MKGFTAVTVLATMALAGCGGGGPDGPSDELLEATGPPGEALLPRVEQAVRRLVERSG